LKGKRGRGTAQEDKPPILGMIQRNGLVIIEMLPYYLGFLSFYIILESMDKLLLLLY
jgi:hypothetical protein